MKIFRNLSRVLKISSAIAQGQKVSEYQIAWAYADLMLPELIEALKSGVSRSDAITALAVATQVKRSVACDVLCKKLKKAGYVADDDLEETDEQDDKQVPSPSTPAVKKKKTPKRENPIGHVIPEPVIPIPVPSADISSDATEYKKGTAIPMLDSAHARTPESPPQNKTSKHKWVDGVFAGENDHVTEEDKEFALRSEKFLKAFPLEKEITRINKMQDEARARGEMIPDNNGESIGTFNVVDGGGLK